MKFSPNPLNRDRSLLVYSRTLNVQHFTVNKCLIFSGYPLYNVLFGAAAAPTAV